VGVIPEYRCSLRMNLKEIHAQEDCNEIIRGIYTDMFNFLETTEKSYVIGLQLTEISTKLKPLVRYIPAKDNNVEKLAGLIAEGANALAREFEGKYTSVLTKESKLVCNGLETGGLQLLESSNKKIRMSWYIGVVV